jgi:hypothetical protein
MRGALAGPRRSVGRLTSFVVIGGCVVLLLLLIVLSTAVPQVAIGFALFLGIVLTLGFERAGTFMMILALFFAPMNNVRATGGSSSITASDVLFLVATGLLLPSLIGKKFRAPGIYLAAASGMVALGFMASLLSETPLASLLYMAKLIVAGIVLPVVFMWWRPNLRILHILAMAYVAGEIVSVGYSLIDGAQVERAYGLTTHVNNFGLASLLALALLPFVWSQLPRTLRPGVWFAGLICFWGVWTSGSRAALLMVALIALLFPLLERSGKVAWLGAFAGASGLLFLSQIRGADQESALGRLLGGSASVNSDHERSDALKLGWSQFNEHPLTGRGFVDVIDFHNIYLAIAVAVGAVGVFAMLALLWSAVQPVFMGSRPYGLMAYAALGYAGFGALSTNLWDRFVWIVLAMVLAARILDEDSHFDEDSSEIKESARQPLVLVPRTR